MPCEAGVSEQDLPRWWRLLAVGLIADDLSASTIARFAPASRADVAAALAAARDAGVLGAGGDVASSDRETALAALGDEDARHVHAAVARWTFAFPDGHGRAIDHARAAGDALRADELVALADRAAVLHLSLRRYGSAEELLSLADEMDVSPDDARRARRLCDFATALEGVGQTDRARDVLMRAAVLGESADDPGVVVRAACQYVIPSDWCFGDAARSGLVERAAAVAETADDRVRVLAARAYVENRLPVSVHDGQQLAWVTRPSLARALAEEAVDADVTDGEARLFALLAWRTTHRAPRFLAERLTRGAEALDLAQRLRHPVLEVEAAINLAVDAIESGDRPLYDRSSAVARWVAQRDGTPRLRWRAATSSTGVAYMEGDVDAARRFRREAVDAASSTTGISWIGPELLLSGHEVLLRADPGEMAGYLTEDEDATQFSNPLARAGVAWFFARLGRPDDADRHARRALRDLDEEASMLLLASRVAHVAWETGTPSLVGQAIEILTPWRHHVVVDSNGWWCDGPVSGWLAMLHARRGDADLALDHLREAEAVARTLHDVQTQRRLEVLATVLAALLDDGHAVPVRSARPAVDPSVPLSDRERTVLALIARGMSNGEIARTLSFSATTTKRDTVSIYRKLGVRGRAHAVDVAKDLGLV